MTPHERTLERIGFLAGQFGMTAAQIMGASREKRIATVRHSIMHTLWLEGWTLSDIGRLFNRDHTTVIYAVRKLSPLSKLSPSFPNPTHDIIIATSRQSAQQFSLERKP